MRVVVGGLVREIGPQDALGHLPGFFVRMFQEREQGGEFEEVGLGDDSGGQNTDDRSGRVRIPNHRIQL